MSTCCARLGDQRAPQLIDRVDERVAAAARVEPQVGRDLIVAAARGVQPAARVADLLGQPRLDVHVDVLERCVPRQLAGREPLRRRCRSPSTIALGVLGADQDPCARQHPRVRHRACHVMRQQAPIEADRRVQRRRRRDRGAPSKRRPLAPFGPRHDAQYKRHHDEHERVTFPSSAGDATGVLVTPEISAGGEPPAIVLLQEWWGINDHIKSLADRLANEGFLVVAPDLYHGKIAKDADEAGTLMTALDTLEAMKEIGGAAAFLKAHPRSNGKVGVIGFCLGGALSFAAACHVEGLSAVVPFYGVPPAEKVDYAKVTAPILAHFAKNDEWATVAGAEAIKAAVTGPMELHVYDAGHAFVNDTRPEAYDPEAAKLAWDRAITFLRAHTA